MACVIGVDIGTQSTKAVLVGLDGAILAQHAVAYRPDTPKPLWAEQWPHVWFDAVRECIARVSADARAAGIGAESIEALCVSSLYGGSGIPVDREMRPLHPCLIWMDRRATDEVDWVRAHVDVARLGEITGNGVDSYYGYTKMLWLREKRPDVWANVRYFVPPNAYVAYRLTGELAVDHSAAGNIGGVYDLGRRDWSDEALDMLGIPATMMPERLVDSDAVVGGLLREWAHALGLEVGTPVVAGGVDAAVATFAAGATRRGQHVAMIGTSMCWGYLAETADARRGLVSMPHVFDGRRDLYVFGGAITAGASVSWFREQFCHAEIEAARAGGGDAHRLLEAAAAEVSAGSDGVLFLPYLMGERSPVWDAKASGAVAISHARASVPRGARRARVCAQAQHRGGRGRRARARCAARRGRRRRAFGSVDAEHRRHHRLPGVDDRRGGRGGDGRGAARRARRGSRVARGRAARLGHARRARAPRRASRGVARRALRAVRRALSGAPTLHARIADIMSVAFDFHGRSFLVTGASSGIGRAAAVALRGGGARVVAAARNARELERLAHETGCEPLELDVGCDASVRAALSGERMRDAFDGLINCAGVTSLAAAIDTTADEFDRVMAVNARGAMLVARHVARAMIRAGRGGSIVNVSSQAALVALPSHLAYCASKAALDAMTRVLCVELGPHGIRVNSVNPTVTLTPMAERAWSDPHASGPMLAAIPLGRFARVADVVAPILFLSSDAAAMVSGVALPVDGGYTAR